MSTRSLMRVRVRKDTAPIEVTPPAPEIPWSVRAASTLPHGARISNPLFGDDPAGSIAVLDSAAAPELAVSEIIEIARKADGALIVLDSNDSQALLTDSGFTTFSVNGSDCLFAASYPVESATGITVLLPDAAASVEESSSSPDEAPSGPVLTVSPVAMLAKAHTDNSSDDSEERFVLGVVLEPDSVDSQGDTISAQEIRQAAHRYMEEQGNVGLQHQVFVNDKIKILESYIAPADFKVGDELVKAGTWLMAFRIVDDSIWKAVKTGLLNGLSIGGLGLRIPIS